MTENKNSIFAALAFGLIFSLALAMKFNIHYALIAGPISGLVFGLILYFFVTSRRVQHQTQINISDEEKIIYLGGANHFLNGEAVGGKLYLLNDRVEFKSHNFNIQNHELVIATNQIKNVSYYNTLGLIPNGLAIETIQGQKEKFVLNNRRQWKEKIDLLKMS